MVLSRVRKKGYIRALSLGYKHRLNLYKFTQYLVKYKSLLNKYRYNKSIIIVLMKFVQLYLMYILFVYKRI